MVLNSEDEMKSSLTAILPAAKIITLKRRDTFRPQRNTLYLVNSGVVKVSASEKAILRGKGEFLHLNPLRQLLDGSERPWNGEVKALTANTKIESWTAAKLQSVKDKEGLFPAVALLYADHYEMAEKNLDSRLTLTRPQRIIQKLLETYDKYAQPNEEGCANISWLSHELLGEVSSANRVCACVVTGDFKRRGALHFEKRFGHTLKILNRKALEEFIGQPTE